MNLIGRTITGIACLVGFTMPAIAMDLRAMVDLRPQPGAEAQADGALTAYDLAGATVRCDEGVPVGVLVPSRGVSLTNGIVEGCRVGVALVSPQTEAGVEALAATAHVPYSVVSGITITGASDAAATKEDETITIQGTTIQATSVGIWLGSLGGAAESNSCYGNGAICLFVPGSSNTIRQNRSFDMTKNGILVTGAANLIEANEIRRSAKSGIHLARMIPHTDVNLYIKDLHVRAAGNTIRNNTALQNATTGGADIREFMPESECGEMDPMNIWIGNIANTRKPSCLQ